jgi:hypothetical protein
MPAGIVVLSFAFATLQKVLAYFSAEGVTTVQSLFARAIGRFLGWLTFRDQVSTHGTHDPRAVSFAEAALRHLTTSIVPWKNISGMLLCVFADHSVRQDDNSAYGSYVSSSLPRSGPGASFCSETLSRNLWGGPGGTSTERVQIPFQKLKVN